VVLHDEPQPKCLSWRRVPFTSGRIAATLPRTLTHLSFIQCLNCCIDQTIGGLQIWTRSHSAASCIGCNMKPMKTAHFKSPSLAFLSVLVVLFLAMTQPALVFVFAFLIPFWFFVADVVRAEYRVIRESCNILPIPILLVFSPRPPPPLS
jgi:ABC-type uncharacterized transport system permease subunit